MARISIWAEQANLTMTATLNSSATAKALGKVLPVESSAQTWGDEVYFEIPLEMPEQEPHATVPSGTVAYWPPGHAFCIFFGQTPYSPVNVIGTLDGDPTLFRRVRSGDKVRVEAATEKKRGSKG